MVRNGVWFQVINRHNIPEKLLSIQESEQMFLLFVLCFNLSVIQTFLNEKVYVA